MNDSELRQALRDIIEGKIVKRSKHELVFKGRNVRTEFIDELSSLKYRPVTVDEVAVQPGQRVPAFYLDTATAYFGWIFWEKFTELRLRKLFGTVVRNEKGDWLIQIPAKSTKTVYSKTDSILEMDIDRPFEL